MTVRIRLLGGFEVQVDGVPVPSQAWSRRNAASLVKLLALADGRRLHREQVIDALWPDLPVEAAAPRLHKAAHYARRALGATSQGMVLRNELVALLPDAEVSIDLPEFERAAAGAAPRAAAEAAAAALDVYAGRCCPTTSTSRGPRRTASRAGPAPRPAASGRAVGGAARGGAGRRAGPPGAGPGQRRPGRRAGGAAPARAAGPGAAARARHRARPEGGAARSCGARRLDAAGSPEPTAERAQRHPAGGRRAVGDRLREQLAAAQDGRGGTLLVTGPPGVGKSACSTSRRRWPAARGWRTGTRHRLGRRGALAVRPGAGGARRPLPPAPGAARRARRPLPRGDRAGAVGRHVTWSRRVRPPAAVRRRGRAAAARAAGRGLLLVVDDIHEADEASLRLLHYLARVPRPTRCCLCWRTGLPATRPLRGGARQPGRRGASGPGSSSRRSTEAATRRLLAERYPDLDEATRSRSGRSAAGCRSPPWSWRGRQAPGGAGGDLPALPARRAADAPAGRPARLDVHAPTSSSPSRGSARPRPTGTSRRPRPACVVERSAAATGSATRWCARPSGTPCRRPRRAQPGREVAEQLAAAGGPAGPGRAPVPRRRPAVAGDPLRAAGGRDRRCAGRLPRRPQPGRGGPRVRDRRDARAPAGPARRPAHGAGRPGRGGELPGRRRR